MRFKLYSSFKISIICLIVLDFQYGIYLHHLGHVLGLLHEWLRQERDNYLHILDKKISKLPNYKYKDFKTPYDMKSIMHYKLKKHPFVQRKGHEQLMPLRAKHLSFLDVKVINKFYRCAGECDLLSFHQKFPI